MEVKPGYKQTEVGVIPEEWEVSSVGREYEIKLGKMLVVDDKWLATLAAAVQGELDRVSQTLTGRIRQLAERYATPLPQLTGEVATLANHVDRHLNKMGFAL